MRSCAGTTSGSERAAPATENPVAFFVLNLNRWQEADTWPPDNAEPLELFLHSPGGDRQPLSSGLLSVDAPREEEPDHYEFDPRDPVMSLDTWRSRAVDQAPNDCRRDVLRYVTGPLSSDVLVIGEPELVLWAASTAPDTDFVARLIELRLDGTSVALSRAVVRARYREGYDRELLLETGEPVRFHMTLSPIAVLLGAGTRLRLDLTSSDFPNFDRNHNTGKPFWSDRELLTATQTVFHDRVARVSRDLALGGRPRRDLRGRKRLCRAHDSDHRLQRSPHRPAGRPGALHGRAAKPMSTGPSWSA